MTSFVQGQDGTFRLKSSLRGLQIGVIAKRASTIDYAMNESDIRAAEKGLLEKITGIHKKNILTLNQMHGDVILAIDTPPHRELLMAGDADGFITPLNNICLVIRSADCVPVFVFDRKNRILGAVHSGWRGTAVSIARKLIREMKDRYGSEYGELFAFILPSIGPESYMVRSNVADLFPSDIVRKNGCLFLNLWQNIERSLNEEGMQDDHIFNSRLCTLQNRSEFFSSRGGDGGRNLNFGYVTFTEDSA
jgi:YfiH family protein